MSPLCRQPEFMGDRHHLPAVGRGGVLDHAARWTRAESTVSLETVRRFSDPGWASSGQIFQHRCDSSVAHLSRSNLADHVCLLVFLLVGREHGTDSG